MDRKKYKQIRAIVAFFISLIVAISVTINNYILALIAVLTGMIFLIFARSKTKITVDERERTIREKAAQITYAIFTPTLGIGAVILTFLSKSVSQELFIFGILLSYLTLFLITLYSITFYILNRKYSGSTDEE